MRAPTRTGTTAGRSTWSPDGRSDLEAVLIETSGNYADESLEDLDDAVRDRGISRGIGAGDNDRGEPTNREFTCLFF